MRIPVVDLKPFLYGAPSERLGVARGFGDALETTGFAVIVGHDVPEALASETYATMKAYFALPLEAKLRDSPPEKTKAAAICRLASRASPRPWPARRFRTSARRWCFRIRTGISAARRGR